MGTWRRWATSLGSNGRVRADYLYRNYDNFYDDRIDTTTGTVTAVRGVNYQYAESFGQPIAYQLPRTFRISVGLGF